MKKIAIIGPLLFVMAGLAYGSASVSSESDNEMSEGHRLVRNGCISNMSIRRVNFLSPTTGIIEVRGSSPSNKLVLTLKNRCPGIRTQGYVHKAVNNQFCKGDVLRVINSGAICIVDSIEPYVELDQGQGVDD